jgi:hypothetical protein
MQIRSWNSDPSVARFVATATGMTATVTAIGQVQKFSPDRRCLGFLARSSAVRLNRSRRLWSSSNHSLVKRRTGAFSLGAQGAIPWTEEGVRNGAPRTSKDRSAIGQPLRARLGRCPEGRSAFLIGQLPERAHCLVPSPTASSPKRGIIVSYDAAFTSARCSCRSEEDSHWRLAGSVFIRTQSTLGRSLFELSRV